MIKNIKKARYTALIFLFSLLGFALGWLLHTTKDIASPVLIREESSNYKLVKPALLLQVPEDESNPELQSLKKIVAHYIEEAINSHNADDVSMYFRELNTDRWIGVNTDDKYTPSSMLKTASMIAFLRAAQENTEILSKKFVMTSQLVGNDTQDYHPPIDPTKNGEAYTGEELLSHMITDSDNNAFEAVNSIAGSDIISKTYSDLKIPLPEKDNNEQNETDFATVKMISRLFRALYNGTYISPSLSEKALDLLSKTNFNDGLVAGIPQGITVAHKFGEHTLNVVSPLSETNKTTHQLHDCGIIYASNNPYFLCIMTKGNEFSSLQKIISDISGIVWNETTNSRK